MGCEGRRPEPDPRNLTADERRVLNTVFYELTVCAADQDTLGRLIVHGFCREHRTVSITDKGRVALIPSPWADAP